MRPRVGEPRPYLRADTVRAHALVASVLGDGRYASRALELIAAADGGDTECQGVVIERGDAMHALALFGPVAGALDVWRLRLLLLASGAEPREIGRTILGAVMERARETGARLLTAEFPADAALGATLTAVRASGFRQEARIPDFFREGVALLFLRREL